MSGPTRSRPTPTTAWCFRACRNRPGRCDKEAGAWYFHRFYDFQPDLNTSNPHVQAEILKIMGFWIQLGVSGFRMDAVPFVIATKGAEGAKAGRAIRHAARRSANSCNGGRATPSSWPKPTCCRKPTWNISASDGDRMHMMFNFHVNQHLFYALASADCRPLAEALKATKPRPATAQWGLFLRNHDELDLGRLTKAQRDAVFKAFGPDKNMQLYDRGIRRRLAPMLGGDRRRLELAYSLMFTLPGTPVIRYGDEIGMGDDLDLPERNCARTPMQWSTEPHAGFTESDKPCAPVIDKGPYGYEHVNAAKQRRDPELAAELDRAHHPHAQGSPGDRLGRLQGDRDARSRGAGDALRLAQQLGAVRAQSRRQAARGHRSAVGLPGEAGKLLVNLLTEDHSRADKRGKHTLLLEGLRLSLVPRRRPRLSAEAQRHRYRCYGKTSHPA